MYKGPRSRIRVGHEYREEFGVGVRVHQGSVLSLLLFVIMVEALSKGFHKGCPWELLFADYLMISVLSMEELLVKFKTWKEWSEGEYGEDKHNGVWHEFGPAEEIR